MGSRRRVEWGPVIRANMVRMVVDEERQVADVAAEWGVPATTIATWASRERRARRRAAEVERAEVAMLPDPIDAVNAHVGRLEQEVRDLKEERELYHEEVSTLESALKQIREITDGLVS